MRDRKRRKGDYNRERVEASQSTSITRNEQQHIYLTRHEFRTNGNLFFHLYSSVEAFLCDLPGLEKKKQLPGIRTKQTDSIRDKKTPGTVSLGLLRPCSSLTMLSVSPVIRVEIQSGNSWGPNVGI